MTNSAQYERITEGPLLLNGESEILTLIAIHLNGTLLTPEDYELNPQTLVLSDLPDQFELTVVTKFDPKKTPNSVGCICQGIIIVPSVNLMVLGA